MHQKGEIQDIKTIDLSENWLFICHGGIDEESEYKGDTYRNDPSPALGIVHEVKVQAQVLFLCRNYPDYKEEG